MAKTSSNLDTPLRGQVDRLAAFEPQGMPVVSLYLNLAVDQHGREQYDAFCRKAFADQVKSFPEDSAERASLERDIERIQSYLAGEAHRSSNALAVFASAGSGEFFEAVQLDAPIEHHWLFIGAAPHIYPLVRLIDQFPRYAVVQLDTNHARILVFALGSIEKRADVTGVKTRRHSMGGWSQARYQRHTDNVHLHHVKEVVEALDRAVREDNVQHVIIAADDVVAPMFKDALPQPLADKVTAVVKFDRVAPDDEVAAATLDVLRKKDAETDGERVADVIGAWRAGGLGVAGPDATMRALQMGQVEELLIAATPEMLKPIQTLPDDARPEPVATETSAPAAADDRRLHLSDEFVTRAHQTGARVRIIEDAALLADHGGIAALLRFRI